MKKGKAAKKAAIAVVTAVAVGGVSVGGVFRHPPPAQDSCICVTKDSLC